MSRPTKPAQLWLAAIVAVHLIIAVFHGAAHSGAAVPLSPAAALFVLIVIFGGPLAGLTLTWWEERLGAWVIMTTMAGSLLFGLLNHFILDGVDQVSHVAGEWQPLFGTTAVLLALTEALGSGLALFVATTAEEMA
jgi:hypothetical protein